MASNLRQEDKNLLSAGNKIRIGNKLYFGDDFSLVAEVVDNTTSRGRTLRFLYDGDYQEFRNKLKELGETPIPKYLNRNPDKNDHERYQTVYAKVEGAVSSLGFSTRATISPSFNETIP